MENTEERSMLVLEFVKLVTAPANLVSVVIKLISECEHNKSNHPDQG